MKPEEVAHFALDLAPLLMPGGEVDLAVSGSLVIFPDHTPYGFGAVAGFIL